MTHPTSEAAYMLHITSRGHQLRLVQEGSAEQVVPNPNPTYTTLDEAEDEQHRLNEALGLSSRRVEEIILSHLAKLGQEVF